MAITDVKITTTAGINELRSINSNYVNGSSSLAALTYKALAALDSTNDADIYTATTGTHGISIPVDGKDAKYVILLKNVGTSSNADVYVVKGDASYYGATANKALTLTKATGATATAEESVATITAESEYVITAICLDSAKYMQTTGSRKGSIVICGATTDVEVAIIKLP